jgi:radical SAM superfamily enzyme
MRDANVTFLEIGLQSTGDTALATVERRLKIQNQVVQAFRPARQANLKVRTTRK